MFFSFMKKAVILDFLFKYWPPMLGGLISFGLSFIEEEDWVLKLLIVLIPWIITCLALYPLLHKQREKEIKEMADRKNKEMPDNMICIQKIVEDFLNNKAKWNSKNYSETLNSVCDIIRSLYVVNGTHTVGYEKFSVSIKEIQSDNGQNMIREVCRDSSTTSITRKLTALQNAYPLENNTPYKTIVDQYEKNNKPIVFIETDVHEKIKNGEYKCTRSDMVGENNVPYKSVCVSPILPLINPQASNKIRGFVCIDAEATNCFNKDDAAHIIYHEFVSGVLFKIMEIQSECVNN